MFGGNRFHFILVLMATLVPAVLLGLASAAMEPPAPGELERYRADGSFQARQAFAQAIGNNHVTPQRIADMHRRLRALHSLSTEDASAPPSDWKGMPTKGTVHLFALLIDFQDTPPSNSTESIQAKLFGDGQGGFPMESLRNFYRRSSLGQLEIAGSTLGWYTAPYPRSSVPQTTQGREGLIEEALNSFEAQGHDFSIYDNDGDGFIDYFLVIWTGPDTGWANFWWGYQTSFSDGGYSVAGKRLADYSWQWEANPFPGEFSPEVTIHETGHALGLPDYYDYDDDVGPRGGVGGLDVMDAVWGDHNAFSKFVLDWVTPVVCNSPGAHRVSLRSAADTGDSLIAMPEASSGSPFGEFFLVQNRARTGNDVAYPTDGLLIWHVDSRVDLFAADFLSDNSYTDNKLLRLMEADGLEEIEQNGWADAGDFYTVGKSFGPDTAPGSNRYQGSQTGVEVASIAQETDAVGFDLTCAQEGYCGGIRPVITSVKFVSSTHKFKVSGSGFTKGMQVYFYGQRFPTKYKGANLLKAQVQSVTRGYTIEVRVVNPDTGCSSEPFLYTRQ
jgi:M6 family metalloprotease-like protein